MRQLAPGHPNLWRTSTSLHRCADGGEYARTVSPTTAHAASAATSVPQARGWRGHPLRGGCRLAPRRSYAPSCSIILPVGAMVSSLREGCESVEDSSASPISPSLQSPRQLCGSVAPPSPITGVIGSGGSEIGPAGPDRSPSPQQRLRPSTLSCRDRRPALITASAHRSTAGRPWRTAVRSGMRGGACSAASCARSAPYDAERVQRAGGVARDVEGVAIGGDDRAAGSAGRGDRGSDLQRGQVDH